MLIKTELGGAFISEENASSDIKEVFSFKEEFALISSINIIDISNLTIAIILIVLIVSTYKNGCFIIFLSHHYYWIGHIRIYS